MVLLIILTEVCWFIAFCFYLFRMEYFDDMATVEGTSVDGNVTYEPAAISQKNLHIEGVQLFFDEISSRRSPSRSRSSSEGSPPQVRYGQGKINCWRDFQ